MVGSCSRVLREVEMGTIKEFGNKMKSHIEVAGMTVCSSVRNVCRCGLRSSQNTVSLHFTPDLGDDA